MIPRGDTYSKPVYVLVGRWTGSIGEGMAVGFDGMNRAKVIGTEMHRLAGGMEPIKLLNSNFSFRISIEKMYHPNGTLRELFVPKEYVTQTTVYKDEFIDYAITLIKSDK